MRHVYWGVAVTEISPKTRIKRILHLFLVRIVGCPEMGANWMLRCSTLILYKVQTNKPKPTGKRALPSKNTWKEAK